MMTESRTFVFVCLTLGIVSIPAHPVTSTAAMVQNSVTVSTRDQLIEAVRKAGPGTTILISPGTYTFAGNHWYCLDNPSRSNRLELPVEETKGTYGEDPQFVNVEKHHLQLKRTTRVRDAGVRSQNER